MVLNASHAPKLCEDGAASLQKKLDNIAEKMPGCYLSVASADSVLFSGASGPFDVLDGSRIASNDDVMWFASTTKLLTSICILQLVDAGKLSLDQDVTSIFPQLAHATKQIFKGLDDQGNPIMEDREGPITLGMMLNQTSGFGMEFGAEVPKWKKVAKKGLGFVNSCKIENLIHTPPVTQPGITYAYGNSAEWLGLLIPLVVGTDLETHLQSHVLQPLGMTSTTFYPLEKHANRTMPTRFWSEENKRWEELTDQLPLLTLPREKSSIEYPVAGGGIFSNFTDYIKVLQHLLKLKRSIDNPDSDAYPYPDDAILSRKMAASLFQPTLSDSAKVGMAELVNLIRKPSSDGPEHDLKPEDTDWTTGMCLYDPKNGRRYGGFGRQPGSVGWGGAAGTEYWIDPKTGIACVFTTQMLPGSVPMVKEAKEAIERAVYERIQV